jgi:hypothetical protein
LVHFIPFSICFFLVVVSPSQTKVVELGTLLVGKKRLPSSLMFYPQTELIVDIVFTNSCGNIAVPSIFFGISLEALKPIGQPIFLWPKQSLNHPAWPVARR